MRKILLVEDERLLIDLYKKELEKEGFEVEVAENGIEAEKKLKSQKFDLVLLDILMPKMSGDELLEKIKKEKFVEKVPFIVISNFDTPEIRKKVEDLGAKKYILKTDLTPKKLVEIVKKELI